MTICRLSHATGIRQKLGRQTLSIKAAIPDLRSPHQRCETCPIRHKAVCSYSSPAQLVELDEIKFYRDYEAGQEIVGQGENTQSLGSIVSGVVALQKTMEDGRRQMVGLLFPADFVGRPLRPISSFDAVAVTPVRMCMFRRGEFERILRENEGLERRLLEMTLDELDAARDWMLLLGRKSAREKLSSFLLLLARRHAARDKKSLGDGAVVDLPLTREAIAEFIGLTIETVSRQFTALRNEGIVETGRNSFSVEDLAALSEMAGEDPDDLSGSAPEVSA